MIDIVSEGVLIEWTCIQLVRVMKVAMDVTLSVWVGLYHGRLAYYAEEPERNVNRPLDEPEALEDLIQSMSQHVGARGNVLHR